MIEDPSYLARKNMYVYADLAPNAPVIDPEGVDWAEIGRGIRTFMLRQRRGPATRWARFKFMMSNNFSVYCTTRRGVTCSPVRIARTAPAASGSRIRSGSPTI